MVKLIVNNFFQDFRNYWDYRYWPIVVRMLYKMVLTFESVDEILKCDHSNESYWAVLSSVAVYYAVQCGSKLQKRLLILVEKKNRFFCFFFSLVLMIPSFKWILWRGIWMAVPFNYWYLSFITLIKSRFSVGIIYFYLQDSTFRDITLQVRKKWNNSYCLWHYYLTTLLKNN